ncbi:MAG: C10 family peptidase [Alistipes sp.]|nr:C10 family peptidase [Alistipes sp.]
MKKVMFVLFMAVTISLIACNQEDGLSVNQDTPQNPYEVTPEMAINRLMQVADIGSTRSLSISSIKTISKDVFITDTRTSNGDGDTPAIYIVDIPNGGCAIMGADTRLKPIYAILDNTKFQVEDLVAAHTRTASESNEEDLKQYITYRLNTVITADIASARAILPPVEIDPYPRLDFWEEVYTYNYVTPLLDTKWGQGFPYNLMFSNNEVGCATVAIGQFLAYHQHPNSINNNTFNWNLINQCVYGGTPSASAFDEVSDFLHSINLAINGGNEQNINSISDVALFLLLHTNKFNNINVITYNSNTVINMLNQSLPVYMRGREVNATVGHAWVVDGCNDYRIEYWERRQIGENEYQNILYNTLYYELLHCNYGYDGMYDGFYESDFFYMGRQTSSMPSIGDYDGPASGETFFNTDLYMIQYNLRN